MSETGIVCVHIYDHTPMYLYASIYVGVSYVVHALILNVIKYGHPAYNCQGKCSIVCSSYTVTMKSV